MKFEVRIRVLENNLEEAMKLADEIIRTSDVTDVKRLTELIAQVKSRLQVSLSSNGHTVSAMRALSYQSRYAFYQDATLGIEYYQHILKLDEMIRTNPKKVVDKLQAMIGKVELSESQIKNADLDGNGRINILDIIKLKNMLLHLVMYMIMNLLRIVIVHSWD